VASALGIRAEAAGKADLLEAIEGFLAERQASGRRVLLVADEAQNLPPETLEELRMLTNLRTVAGRSPLQCFLVGQPQLKETLARPGLAQLRQRVIASCHLEPLTAEETRNYIEHRLRIAGWRGRPVLEESVPELIHRASGGVPRRINLLFGRLLLFGAIEEREVLDEAAVEEVLLDLKAEGETTGTAAPRSPTGGQGDHAVGSLPSGSDPASLAARVEALEKLLLEVARTTTALLRRETGKEDPDEG
jgi:general secretion pathway protein A